MPAVSAGAFGNSDNRDLNPGGFITFEADNEGSLEMLFPSFDEDFTPYAGLSLRARTESLNSAGSFSIFFYDENAAAAYRSFSTASFPNPDGFTTVTVPMTDFVGIDLSSISSWGISAGTGSPTGILHISFEHLELVPEPTTYALLLGAASVGIALWRRRRGVATES